MPRLALIDPSDPVLPLTASGAYGPVSATLLPRELAARPYSCDTSSYRSLPTR